MNRANPLRHIAVAAIVCLALSFFARIQAQTPTAAQSDDALAIAGDVTQPLTIKPADLKAMPRTTVMISDEGRQVSYEGVLVGELLGHDRRNSVGRHFRPRRRPHRRQHRRVG